MNRRMNHIGVLLVGIGVLTLAMPAQAVITRKLPLNEVVEGSEFILTVKVEAVDPDRPGLVLVVDEHLKGKFPINKLAVNLKGDDEAAKAKQTPDLLKRVAPKLPIVLFASLRDSKYVAFAYTNGTWFQMTGVKDDDSDNVRWSFTHLEPYLRRTYKGTTAELQKALGDYLNDKKALPDTDPKEKPGLGPEVEPEKKDKPEDKKSSRGAVARGPVFGVIPAVLIGGPLAMLAMLFPSVFGGWKRWLTLLSVGCTNSTLYTAQYFFSNELVVSRWPLLGTTYALWFGMTMVTLAGMVWAFLRHFGRVMEGEAPFAPSRMELLVLGIVSVIGIGVLVYPTLYHQSLYSPQWMPMLPYCAGAWGAFFYVLYAYGIHRRAPALATEAVMLTIMAFATTGLATSVTSRQVSDGTAHSLQETGVTPPKFLWRFIAPAKGALASTPLVVGDRVYVGIAHDDVFTPYGTLYCLDRATGNEVWHFDNKKKMKQIFSTPCVVEDKIYIGEGFHQDSGCKLYCLNAASGERIWDFQTESHTESSPYVVNGKLYCGAGDDGLYCLDAVTGKKLWNFPGYHIDASPVVVGKRLYVGSVVGDIQTKTAIMCLDADTGEKKWLIDTPLPVPGSPTVVGDLVYFGVGNGRMNESDEKPAGQLLCVHAADGTEAWSFKTVDGILCRPAVDGHHVYFGARDHHVYSLNSKNGRLCWERDLGGPVVTESALMPCVCGESTAQIIAVASQGRLAIHDAATGHSVWSHDFAEEFHCEIECFSSAVLEAAKPGDATRRFYVGMTHNSTGRTAMLYCYEYALQPTAK